MSAATKCPKCYDEVMGCNTGEVGQGGYLDCLCGAAESRRAMEVALSISEAPTWMRDTAWRAYSMGVAALHEELETAQQIIVRSAAKAVHNSLSFQDNTVTVRFENKEDAGDFFVEFGGKYDAIVAAMKVAS